MGVAQETERAKYAEDAVRLCAERRTVDWKLPPAHDDSTLSHYVYEIFVHRYGKEIADWLSKELGVDKNRR